MTGSRAVRAIAAAILVVAASVAPVVQPVAVASAGNSGSGSTTLVTDCQTISTTGHYTLANDVDTSDSSNCIQIDADDVTFDGNGHVITYVGSGNGPSAVSVSGGSNVVVRDVTTRYFSTGVRLYGADDGEVTGVTIEPESGSNDPGANANGIALYAGSDRNVIRNNAIDKPGQWGDAGTTGSGIYVVDSHDNVLVGNEVWNPSDVGIQLDSAYRNNLTDNEIRADQWDTQRTVRNGIRLDSDSNETVLQGNYVYGQSSSSTQALQDGIYVASDDNVLTSNYVQSTHYSGVVVYGDGNELDSNTATANVEHGFEIRSVDVVLTNNLATGNRYSGLYLDGTTSGTVLNNTASGNSDWDVELVATAGLDAENTALSSGGPGVTLRGASATIKGVSARPTPDGMDHVGQFFEVSGGPTVDVSYTDAAAAGVAEENLSLWHYDGSSWSPSGGSVDTVSNVVSGSVTAGVYAPLANDTRVPNVSNFDATSPANGELRVSFDADERLDEIVVTLANESGTVTTLETADFTESGYNTFTYENTSTLSPGSYDATLDTAADAADNDGANGETASATVSGVFEITAFDAVDAGDGDRIVTDGDVVALSATVTGQNVTSVTTDASSFGGGHVTYSDPDGDGVYEGTFAVDMPYNLEYLRGLSVTATDDLGRTATATTTLDLDTTVYVDSVVVTDLTDGDGSVGHGDSVRVSVEVTDFSNLTVVGGTDVLGVPNVTLADQGNGWYNATVTVDAATADPDGLVYVWANATDAAGNSHERRANYMFIDTSDLDPPTVTGPTAANLDGPDDDVGDGDQVAVSVTATDGLGVDEVTADASDFGAGTVALTDGDGDDVYEGTFTVNTTSASPDGAYGIEITAYNVRNRRSIETTNELTLVTGRDLTPPTISDLTASDPFDDEVVTDGDVVDVAVTVTDAKSGVDTVTADASSFGAGTVALTDPDGDDVYEGSFTVDAASASSDGWWELTVEATDADGNAADTYVWLSLDRSLASDATPPTINEFDASEGSGDRIFVLVNASERLTVLDVSVRNESGAVVGTISDESFDSGSYGDSYRYFGHFDPPVNGTYDVTLDAAVDYAGNDGASGQTAAVTVGGADDGGATPGIIVVDGQLSLADGTAAANDGVVLVDAADTTDFYTVQTDENGNFSTSAPAGSTYFVVYGQVDGSGDLGVFDGSPDLYTLGSVDDNATLTRTLPAAHPLNVTVVRSDTGTPVENADVTFAHGDAALLDLFRDATDAQGRLVLDGATRPGLEVVGTTHVGVVPPSSSDLDANVTSFQVTGPADETVVLRTSGDDPDIALSTSAYDFGNVSVGDSARANVTVSNEGASTLSVTSVSLSGGDAAHFGLVDDSPFTLAPGESRNVTIEFAPTARGSKAATIAVESDDPDESTVSASLTGNATAEVTNHAPIAADDHYILIQGETLSVSGPGVLANDYDPDGDGIIAALSSSPSNGTRSMVVDGSFTYTPDEDFVGTDSFTYTARDDSDEYANSATITIQVLPDPNRGPTAVDDHYTVVQGETLSVSGPGVLANDDDPDGDSIIAALSSSPSNGTRSMVVDGSFTYTPDEDFVGTDSFSYTPRDDHGADGQFATITIQVLPDPNRGPTAVDDHYTVVQGETLTVDGPGVLANDDDPDGDSIIAALSSSPSNGTRSMVVDGSFTYTPDEDFVGTDSFSYTPRDDSDEYANSATITIQVLPDPNRGPTAVDDHYTVVQGETLSVSGPGVLENDDDPDGDSIIAALSSSPSNGTRSMVVDGSFTYTPDEDFVGTDSFSYTPRDDHGADGQSATITVEVLPDPNRAPTAVDDHYSLTQGETLSVSGPGVLANDDDPDGDSIIAALSSSPSNGTRSMVVDGSFTYTPDEDFVGTDSFSYTPRDDHGADGQSATITIEVLPDPNRAPSTAPDHYVTGTDEQLLVAAPGLLGNDRDLDDDSMILATTGRERHGSVSGVTNGEFSYSPDSDFAGVDTFRYTARDEHGARADYETVTVTVVDVDGSGTIATDADAVTFGDVAAGTEVTATVTVTNVGGSPLTFTGADLTSGGAGAYAVVAGDQSASLSTGETHAVTVSFEPTASGSVAETLRLYSNDPATPTLDVSLTGTGVAGSGGSTGSGSGGSPDSSGGSSSSPGSGTDTTDDAGGSATVTVSVNQTTGVRTAAVSGASAGVSTQVDLPTDAGENVSLDGLDVTPLVDGDFTLNVSASETAPPGAPADAPSGQTPIAYLNVGHSIADADIGEVTFRFRVSKTTLADRGLAPEDVVVYRYHDGQWGAATMNVTGESADEYVVEATVPGLSVFAVGTVADADTETATPAATATPPPTTDVVTSTPEIDDGAAAEPVERSQFPVVPVLAVLALVGAAVAVWFTRR